MNETMVKGCPCSQSIPYSLKFSWLKIFAVFAGRPVLSREMFAHAIVICGQGALDREILSAKSRIRPIREIFNS